MTQRVWEKFCKEVQASREHLVSGDTDPDTAIHEARRHLKKARSLLKLVRSALGDRYQRENTRLRNIARRLSHFRDAAAMIETFDELGYKGFPAVRAGLVELKGEIENAADLADLFQRASRALNPGGPWPEEAADPAVIAKGLRRTRQQAKRAIILVHRTPVPESFHELRKRVKAHRFQLRFTGVDDQELDALDDSLGEAHNLAVLERWIALNPERFGTAGDVAAFRQRVRERRVRLQAKALKAASQFYARPLEPQS